MTAPTICTQPGCPHIVPTGNRCPEHQAAGHDRHGSTRRWRRLRAEILERDRDTCTYCGRPATHADHVTPRAAGGPDHPANLVASCQACNLAKGAAPPPWGTPPATSPMVDTSAGSRFPHDSRVGGF